MTRLRKDCLTRVGCVGGFLLFLTLPVVLVAWWLWPVLGDYPRRLDLSGKDAEWAWLGAAGSEMDVSKGPLVNVVACEQDRGRGVPTWFQLSVDEMKPQEFKDTVVIPQARAASYSIAPPADVATFISEAKRSKLPKWWPADCDANALLLINSRTRNLWVFCEARHQIFFYSQTRD